MPTDAELLQRYVDQHKEGAFGAIVGRYLGLVHGSACRRLGPRVHLAEDVCQRVFTHLAARSRPLPPSGPGSVAASLHPQPQPGDPAQETPGGETRAVRHLDKQSFDSTEPSIEWERVRPLLDEAIDRLPESDHEIVLLRYFGGLSFAEAG